MILRGFGKIVDFRSFNGKTDEWEATDLIKCNTNGGIMLEIGGGHLETILVSG